jgi:hypothetical protein
VSSEAPQRLSPLMIACIGLIAGSIGAILAGASIAGGLFLGVLLAVIVSLFAVWKSRRSLRTPTAPESWIR